MSLQGVLVFTGGGLRKRITVLGLAVTACLSFLSFTAVARGADCNRNGIEDALDLLPSFHLAEPVHYAAGFKPWGVAVVNLNEREGTGPFDIVISNEESHTISVYLNPGNGNFAGTRKDYPTDSYPRLIVARDLDGDDFIDIAIGHSATVQNPAGHASILWNNGNGTFTRSPSYPTQGQNSMCIAAADLDGDQDPDLALGNRETNQVAILRNDGQRTFSFLRNVGTGQLPAAIDAGDLDGDGDQDLITSNENSNNITLLLNDGAAGFTPSISLQVGTDPYDVKAADLDGDGSIDLAVTCFVSNELHVFINRGEDASGNWLGFQPARKSFLQQGPSGMALHDLDGDTDLDLVVAVFGTNKLQVLFNDGAGNFDSFQTYNAGGAPRTVAVGDLDGDGKPDIVTANQIGNDISVYYNQPEPNSQDRNHNGIPDECEADCNSNGLPDSQDLAAGTSRDCNSNGIPDECDLGRFSLASRIPLQSGPQNEGVAAGDFNHDGLLDIAGASFGSGQVSVFINDPSKEGRTFKPAVRYASGSGSTFVAAADIIGATSTAPDGWLDLLVVAQNEGRISILRNRADGTGAFLLFTKLVVGTEPLSVIPADLDGDGDLDMVVPNFTSDNVTLLYNNGNGTFRSELLPGFLDGAISAAVADLNGDGKVDICVASLFAGTLTIYLGPNFRSASPTVISSRPDPTFVIADDLDEDGKPDLVVTNSAFRGGTSNVTVLWNGGGTFTTTAALQDRGKPFAVRAADIDGDGDLDLAACNLNTSTVSVFLNQGDRQFAPARDFPAGSGAYSIFAADFDADGLTDLATADQNGGTVSIIFNTSSPAISRDCNENTVPDECDIAAGLLEDKDGDGVADNCGAIAFHRGDSNGDGEMDISDGVSVLGFLFLGDPAPKCLEAANANNDGDVDLSDAVYILAHIFLGEPAPAPPGPPGLPCGFDPDPRGSALDLGCEFYEPNHCK